MNHNILLQKLYKLGIRGKTLKLLQSFLSRRSQKVIVNGKLSSPREVISGVPQGSVIGPLLFLVLINDIDKDTQHSAVSSFADDTRVTMGIKTEDDAADLQNDLFHIYQWSVENNMQFNALKFELLRYGNRDELKENTVYVNPEFELIEEKENVKDLGVNMTNNCKFNLHITKIAESAKKIASWILQTFEKESLSP